jgi:hypothetical protein
VSNAENMHAKYGADVQAMIVDRLAGGARLSYTELADGWLVIPARRALFNRVLGEMQRDGLVDYLSIPQAYALRQG